MQLGWHECQICHMSMMYSCQSTTCSTATIKLQFQTQNNESLEAKVKQLQSEANSIEQRGCANIWLVPLKKAKEHLRNVQHMQEESGSDDNLECDGLPELKMRITRNFKIFLHALLNCIVDACGRLPRRIGPMGTRRRTCRRAFWICFGPWPRKTEPQPSGKPLALPEFFRRVKRKHTPTSYHLGR